ncbi:MAG: hypothetical protein FWG14_04845 [Peptococcaceae bacterium]|nr:hypothetical protein [Peptococcaceae bacterium]
MHTVIITDRYTTPLFTAHRRLFAPFLPERGGSVCQCSWHEAGTDIEQAVPELYKSIKGYPEWRAIIFIHPQPEDVLTFNPHNPFDFTCNHSHNLLIQENPVPLVRLTHMLAGFPSLGVKDYVTGYTYYDEEAGRFLECLYDDGRHILESEVDDLTDEEREELFEKFGGSIKMRLLEIPYSDAEKAEYTRLTKKYTLKENRPVDVLVLTTREILAPDDREAARGAVSYAWEFHHDEDSSDFWKIYPNTCRFLCYDLLNPEHTLYPRECWRLCLLILTLAVNQVPSQALQAYRLYKADLHIDANELGRVLDRHMANLLSIQAVIQEKMMCVPEVTRDKTKNLVPVQEVSVKFGDVDEGDVSAHGDRLGLTSDHPVPETQFWREHRHRTRHSIDKVLSGLQEVVADKAVEARRRIHEFAGREHVLDRFQVERVQKRLAELEPRVMNAKVYGLLDPDGYQAELDTAGEAVRKSIGLRLTRRNALILSLCALGVYLCGYLPYLITAAKISGTAFGAAWGLAGMALVLLAAGGLLTLWLRRRRLLKKVDMYNKSVMSVFDRVNRGAEVYSDYFSNVCTYMYARSVLSGVALKNTHDSAEGKMRKAHLATLESEIEVSRQLCSLCGVPPAPAAMNTAFVEITDHFLREHPSASPLYELKPSCVKGTVELDNTGESLNAPYSFVSGMGLVREEIYDKKGV